MSDFDPAHRQQGYRVRMDWGPTGAEAVAGDLAVVVDVLSFTTTVSVAVAHGIEVFPFEWRDARAAEHAMRHGATLAVGRFEARRAGPLGRHVSLSPATIAEAAGIERLVLPSPNGSSIAFRLAEGGATVVAAALRNRYAVAHWLVPRLARDRVAVVAAGERWPDGSLRPCAEDLWGAGAVVAALADLGVDDLSPEARVAEQAFRAVEPSLADTFGDLAGAVELAEIGFADDVTFAAAVDADDVVPVLTTESFRAG